MITDEALKHLEEGLADHEEIETLIGVAKGVIGACSRIVIVRTLIAKRDQRARGIDDDTAPEIENLRAEMSNFHKDIETVQATFDVDTFKRIFTTHNDFAKKYEHEVTDYNLKKYPNNSGNNIPNLNGGPR